MNSHDRRLAWMVFLGVALVSIGALSFFNMRTVDASPFPQGSTPPPPPSGPGPGMPVQPGYEPGGPYYHQIYLAHSTDGLTWQTDNVLIRNHASVPSIARWKGSLWMYAADPVQSWLIVLRQDGDVWWETRVQIDGFDPTYAVDPDVIPLPDGRLRLYFLDFSTLGPPPGAEGHQLTTIRSAVTLDGVHFTLEEGARFQSEQGITDPDVVQAADGSWWMYVTAPRGALAAHSTDGLTFREAGQLTDGALSDTVLLDNGTLRQYYCLNGILSRVSTDGLTWTPEAGVRIEVRSSAQMRGLLGFPSVIREADGSWLMAYFVDTTPSDAFGTGPGDNQPGP